MPAKKKALGLGPSREFVETTFLRPEEEKRYKKWTRHYKLRDIDPKTEEPYSDVKYDLRGYWKAGQVPGMAGFGPPQFEGVHGPDTWKQHGHETFSQESKYARPGEGGMWVGETFLEQPKMRRSNAR